MPGSSLWLLPPPYHPLTPILTTLIAKTSSHFSSPHLFLPHITLTSDISPTIYSPDPQTWLSALKFPLAKDVKVSLGNLNSEDVFFRRLYSKVEKDGVKEIGKVARKTVEGFEREDAARKWAEEEYMPHCSLLYSDCTVSAKALEEIQNMVKEAGVNLNGEGELGGWTGGTVVLVPTYKPIAEWTPIASLVL